MTHWSHFPCFKHTHCSLVEITSQRLEWLWLADFFFLFVFIKGWKHFFMSAFHIMLHNAVHAHKSHVAGLTPLPVKLAQTAKIP